MAEPNRGGAGGGQDGWTPERSVAGKRNPWSIVAVISIATFMTVLDTSIANVALNHIAGGMAISYDEATWVTTSFLVATAIVIPISGWLANVVGRKRYYMISVAHAPEVSRGFRWNDPAFAIKWPLEPTVISSRDASYPLLDLPGGV